MEKFRSIYLSYFHNLVFWKHIVWYLINVCCIVKQNTKQKKTNVRELEIHAFKRLMNVYFWLTFTSWLGDTQGHEQCHHSIERIRLPIRL